MSTAEIVLSVAVAVLAVALVVLWRATARRVRLGEERLRPVAASVGTVAPAMAGLETRVAAVARDARRAARAAGVPEDPPQMVMEPVTAPLVRAVALTAGIGRGLRRLSGGSR
jgi:hypothetical protein